LEAVKAETLLRLPPKGSKESASFRECLELWEERTGKRDKRLDAVDVPDGLGHLWMTFWSLYRGEAISCEELQAWSSLAREQLTPWEAETIRFMSFAAVREARSGN
jgi:hypothetical protein